MGKTLPSTLVELAVSSASGGGVLPAALRLNSTHRAVGSLGVAVSEALRRPGGVGVQLAVTSTGTWPSVKVRLNPPPSEKSPGLAPPRTGLLAVSVALPSSLTVILPLLVWPTSTSPKSSGPGASGVEPKPAAGCATALQVRV